MDSIVFADPHLGLPSRPFLRRTPPAVTVHRRVSNRPPTTSVLHLSSFSFSPTTTIAVRRLRQLLRHDKFHPDEWGLHCG
ncbi:cystathionine beta-synthase (CBS) family protein [Actinidia rufa]|uniref:Cystathionine beta-synthase (CBS) family protein n=1 Tax=Actinidia rufa TaxID=165716 RepID=A0A7J0D976_9ERIC|nr:cystathionine beta-synthase (CBS) family protein [Actinidia rufa]